MRWMTPADMGCDRPIEPDAYEAALDRAVACIVGDRGHLRLIERAVRTAAEALIRGAEHERIERRFRDAAR